MISTQRRLRFCICLVVCMLIFIWGNSLLPAEISQNFSDWVKTVLLWILPGDGNSHQEGSGLLRKIAHFTEFTALGLLLCWLLGMLKKSIHLPMFWGFAVACIDETIQIFVPGRGPGLRDVLIDGCGVLTGVILLRIGYYVRKRKQPNHLEDM